MATKWKSVKVDEMEIKLWEDAAKMANEDGRPTFNHWARKVLNRAAKRVISKKERV